MTDYLQYTPTWQLVHANRNKLLKMSKKKRKGRPFYPGFFQDYNSRTQSLLDFVETFPDHPVAIAAQRPDFPRHRLSSRIWHDPLNIGHVVITNIREFTSDRRRDPSNNFYAELEVLSSVPQGNGLGKWAMSEICELLDKHQLPMILNPTPLDDYTIKEKLLGFYRKFGFKTLPIYKSSMERRPNPWS